jgi:hypothetical protein
LAIPLAGLRSNPGNGGAGFDLRFSLSSNASWAFRLGNGPRTFGFFISTLLDCRSGKVPAQLADGRFIG